MHENAEKLAECIGSNIVIKSESYSNGGTITILQESGVDYGVRFPSQDIRFSGLDNIKQLRGFLNKTIERMEAIAKEFKHMEGYTPLPAEFSKPPQPRNKPNISEFV